MNVGGFKSLHILNRHIMNIWEAYCKPAYYNIYFNTLVAKGLSRAKAEKLKEQYCNYLQRIKTTKFGGELKAITDAEEFGKKLKDIFEDAWKNHIQYIEMPSHYYAYLKFLDSIQALHNDFISDKDRARLIDDNPEIPIRELTPYETEYMKDCKLVALMNPQLLYTLKEYIEKERMNFTGASRICNTYYGDLLPGMTIKDYKSLIQNLWDTGRNVKKGGRHNKISIKYPDGREVTTGILDGLKEIVKFYGADKVIKQKSKIRGEDFIVKRVPVGKESIYEQIDGLDSYYILLHGAVKDRMNIAILINKLSGEKLVITLV